MRSTKIALVVTLITLLGACAPQPGAAPQSSVPQQITLVQGGDANTLDPQGTVNRVALNVVDTFAEALTQVDYGAANGAQVTPMLATSWKLVNDTTWQFSLRSGVKFSNGEAFDATAVKFSFDRLMSGDLKSPQQTFLNSVARVDVVDASTINVTTKAPAPTLPLDLTWIYMVPPAYTKSVDAQTFAIKPVGTGPFVVKEWVKDDHVTLGANPTYWGGKPKLDTVTIKPIPEAATRTAALQTGSADIVTPIGIADVAGLRGQKDVTIVDQPSLRLMYVIFDQRTDPIFKNATVRQALNYAVDKDAIVKSIYSGYAKPLSGQGLNEYYYGFNPDVKPYPYDVDKAKQLLAQAGYPNGFDTTLWASRGNYQGDYETAQAVAGQLAKVGVRVTVKPLEFAVYANDLPARKLTPMALLAFAGNPDADTMFEFFRSDNPYSYFNDSGVDATLAQIRTTTDANKRLQLLHQMAATEHDQALAIWLHSLVNFYGFGNKVQGFKLLANESFRLNGVSVK